MAHPPRSGWLVLSVNHGLHLRVNDEPPVMLDYERRDGGLLVFRRQRGEQRDCIVITRGRPFALFEGAWLAASLMGKGKVAIAVPRDQRHRVTITLGRGARQEARLGAE